MSQEIKKYVDDYQNVHLEGEMLGQGGQGVVFRTNDPDLAIKLVTDESGNPVTDEKSVKRYSNRFKRVRLLPLPEKLNISLPAALLQDNAGYVMQLLSEMVPLNHLWLDGKSTRTILIKDDIPAWLFEQEEIETIKNIRRKITEIKSQSDNCECRNNVYNTQKCEQCKKIAQIATNKEKELIDNFRDSRTEIIYYYKTGGLRRRLNVLYKCASLLARLHGNGMVYGDISPNNIFVSEGIDDSSVWLIDADNIRFEITARGSIVYTPKYGAPELVQEKDGGRPSSDCHAFAVVAFYLLSMIHPFVGKKVLGTDEGDWADEENDDEDIEGKAYAGLFPWVDDLSDDSNSSDNGLPRSLLLTEKLKALFECTFGPGRTFPLMRPTIYHWPEALAQAADITVKCPDCSMNYYYNFIHPETEDHNCPYCKTQRPQLLILESYRWNGANTPLNSPCWHYIREIPLNSELTIPRRLFDDFAMLDSDTSEILISSTDKGIVIKKSDQSKADLSVADGSHPQSGFKKLFSQMMIDQSTPDVQFWIFAHVNSPRLVNCRICGGKK